MTNNIHVLDRKQPLSRLVLAIDDPRECAIAIRGIEKLYPGCEIQPITTLGHAAEILACERIHTVFVGTGLGGEPLCQTIRWFACNSRGATIIAMVDQPDDRHRQEALEAGASCVMSKPALLVAQLRHELECRLSTAAEEHGRQIR